MKEEYSTEVFYKQSEHGFVGRGWTKRGSLILLPCCMPTKEEMENKVIDAIIDLEKHGK